MTKGRPIKPKRNIRKPSLLPGVQTKPGKQRKKALQPSLEASRPRDRRENRPKPGI
jgi:hypothetical protein